MPLATLLATPFELTKGNSIDIRVLAANLYGESELSPVGSGANVVITPEEPTLFASEPTNTNADQITLTW